MNVKPGPATPEGFWVSSGDLIRVIHCKAAEVETLLLRERVHTPCANEIYSVLGYQSYTNGGIHRVRLLGFGSV